jgi:hypothetical protein
MNPKLGKYKHYKGAIVEVIGIAYHSETLEELVVYIHYADDPKLGKNPMFARPKKMFLEKVVVDGKKVPRFRFIG